MTRLDLSEKDIQSAIVDYLRYQGFLVMEFAKPGTHRALRGSVPTGTPDLLALRTGRYVWLEVKMLKGRLTRDQEQVRDDLLAHGAEWHLIRSLDEVMVAVGEVLL